MLAQRIALAALIGCACGAGIARAQTAPLIGTMLRVHSASGPHDNDSDVALIVFSDVIEAPASAYLRVYFADVTLPGGSWLRLTSVYDAAVQDLTPAALADWNASSAYFNGSAVRIELIAGPHTPGNAYAVNQVFASQPVIVQASLCGADNRVVSHHPAVCRLMPAGCTGWMYAPGGCLLSAGHCGTMSDVAQFNVPPSLPDGTPQNPPPSDQYTIDQKKFVNGNLGNDWFHFVCLPNSQTGLLPVSAQGAYIPLAHALPSSFPQPVTVIGHGLDTGVDNQVQQLGDGPLTNFTTVPFTCCPSLRHQVDTTGGNSGSPVIETATGRAVGIHTHGGCGGPNDSNGGTPITLPDLQDNLTCPLLFFGYPDGLVTQVNPTEGTMLRVSIDVVLGTMVPGSPSLHVRANGGAFVKTPMGLGRGMTYQALITAPACPIQLDYYVSAMTTDGSTLTDPFEAPAHVYTASCTPAPGDANGDGYVNLADYAGLPGCLGGPGVAQPNPACAAYLLDVDADVDLPDAGGFANLFTGP